LSSRRAKWGRFAVATSDEQAEGRRRKSIVSRGKLLILSYAFPPSVGGIETVSLILARTFAQRGYAVTVATEIAGEGKEPEEPFGVLRKPGARALIGEIRRADMVLQSNISLRLAWPLWLLFPRKPFVLVFHGPIARPDGSVAWQDRLKRALLWRPYFMSVSRYQADVIRPGSRVIRNPYGSETFRRLPNVERNGDLLFVGRLVTAKGADTLLRAYEMVHKLRPQTTLAIIGSGPEEDALHALAKSLGIEQSVQFLGAKQGNDLALEMNRHKILVVPSRSVPPEACPVVPVEGIACGCVPVASRMGGLPESVGEAGVLFEEGNAAELASTLLRLLESPGQLETYLAKAESHLRQFQIDAVADAYESHFAACRG
jgi:glycosyltransferase involved in cell wall biosynthesis